MPQPGSGESVAFDRVAGSYDETRGGMERGRRIAEVLAGVLPAGPLLEVGVGTGLVAAALTELGRSPVGVDLSLPMLARAGARIPGRIAAGDALRLPVGTGTVAGVYLVHVLHLVGDVPAALAEVARVLRSGGTMVATAFPGEAPAGDVYEEMTRLHDRVGAGRRNVDAPLVTRLATEAGIAPAGRSDAPGVEVTPRQARRHAGGAVALLDVDRRRADLGPGDAAGAGPAAGDAGSGPRPPRPRRRRPHLPPPLTPGGADPLPPPPEAPQPRAAPGVSRHQPERPRAAGRATRHGL